MSMIETVFWLSIAIVVYAYAGYPLVLIGLHPVLRRKPTLPNSEHLPTISLLMAAYNEETWIRKKLENCLSLDYPQDKLKILIGSDGSEDGTNAIVSEFADRGVKLFAFHPNRGKMSVVNRLVDQAQGEICVFSDISELFDRNAIKELARHFVDPSVGIVAGNHIFNDTQSGIGIGTRVYREFKRFLWRIESRLYSTCRCDGCIYACRRGLYPFPADTTINDDVAVPLGVLSQGKRVIFEPKAVIRGDVESNTKAFFAQKVRCYAGRYQNLFQLSRMYQPWKVRRLFVLLSHMVLPTFVPWFLLLALLANGALCFNGGLLYQLLFVCQAGFYLAATIGYFAERFGLHLSPIAIPFYFVTANIGSMLGFLAFISRMQRVTWRKST
jgi:biofilm PGA synthesis N-glycosyltransferase PgaC